MDTFRGLYGPTGAYPVTSPYCVADSVSHLVLVSTLQFACASCGVGSYSLVGGSSTGSPGPGLGLHGVATANNTSCFPCPYGGVCGGGNSLPVPAPGYWGAVHTSGSSSPSLVFIVCPTGYCCDGTPHAPCASVGSCSPGRSGALCGDCDPGMVVGMGSSQCAPVALCAEGRTIMWTLVAAGLLGSAAVQLTLVSGVWLCKGRPSGKMKLVIYFLQASDWVAQSRGAIVRCRC
jgi:hypothetical protein